MDLTSFELSKYISFSVYSTSHPVAFDTFSHFICTAVDHNAFTYIIFDGLFGAVSLFSE